MTALSEVQKRLKVGKENRNDFGKYNYRNCADILEAVKPLLPEGFSVVLSDDLVIVGDRYYVKATVLLSNGMESFQTTAFARESFDKKGMDDSQITGAASSYARKYALNGLFAIDDTKDADGMDNTDHNTKKEACITQDQFDILGELIIETKTDTVKFCKAGGVSSLAELPASKFAGAKAVLEKKKAAMNKPLPTTIPE